MPDKPLKPIEAATPLEKQSIAQPQINTMPNFEQPQVKESPVQPPREIQNPEQLPEIPSQKEHEKQLLTTVDEESLDSKIDSLKRKLRLKKKKPIHIPTVKDEITIKIEQVMEQGLEDAYRELTPIQQQEFKIKGEETAWKIREVLKKTHVKIKEIFKLLVEWLRMLPGINIFFLEQEAKIKADKIIGLHNQDNHK